MGWRKETVYLKTLSNFMFKIQIALYQSLMDPHDIYQTSIKSGL